MKCNYCGREIADDSMFCEFCGMRVIKETGDIKKKKHFSEDKKLFLKYVVGAIIVGVLICVLLAVISDNNAENYFSQESEVPIVDTMACESIIEGSTVAVKEEHKNALGFEKGSTWSYTDRSSGVKTYFVFTSETDVIWLFGTVSGNVFPVGFGKYNPVTGTIKFSASDKLHKEISIYYGEKAIVFSIDQNKKTAVHKYGCDDYLPRFYNGGNEFLLSEENRKLIPNRKLIGSVWKYWYNDKVGEIFFKTWNEAVLIEGEGRERSVAYVCIGDMISIKSGDNLTDENLIGNIRYGNEATLCREGISTEREITDCITLFREES